MTGFFSAILRRVVDQPFADAVLGDLCEERRRRARGGRSRLAAPLWFWRELTLVTIYTTVSAFGAAVRRRRGRPLMVNRLISDIRNAARSLRTAPSFTVVALLVLTLGIGASTAIFSVVDAVILRGLPFDEGDRIVAVSEFIPSSGSRATVAPQNFLDWRAQQDVFTGLAAIAYGDVTLAGDATSDPALLRGQRVTADFFDVLRVSPLVGRAFTRDNEESGQSDVAVISYGLWQRRFGGTEVLGRRLRTPEGSIEIVGVMPPGFEYPVGEFESTEIWVPYVVPIEHRQRGEGRSYYLRLVGRLRDGVSLEQGQSRMEQITAGIAAEFPGWFKNRVVRVEPLRRFLTADVRPWMLLLLAAVGCVLLIACANVANLTLVRATTRARELGVRSALGATRWELARPLLVESLLLAAAGTAAGVLAAVWGVEILRAAMPAGTPRLADIAVNLRVLAASAGTAVVTGLIFGCVPVLQFSRPDVSELLKDRGRAQTPGSRHRWVGPVLVVAEVALAVVLTVGAGLFTASFARVSRIDTGLDVRDMTMIAVNPRVDFSDEAARARAFRETGPRLERALEDVRRLPGLEAATMVSGSTPLLGAMTSQNIGIPDRSVPPSDCCVRTAAIAIDYFRTIGVPVLAGRPFTAEDRRDSSPVVILNAQAAQSYFGGSQAAVGRVVQLKGSRTVVGVVGDTRPSGPESEIYREAYVPLAQDAVVGGWLMVRSTNLGPLLPAIRHAIWKEFPDIAIPQARGLEEHLRGLTARREFNMLLLGLFGLLGLVIASVGLYGVMAYSVAQRTREIGIRMALGAVPRRILHMVLGRAAMFLSGGLILGLTGAWMLAGLVESFLFQVEPSEPVVYAACVAVLAAVALLAAAVPARRASRVDPLIALRSE